jgi:2-polyprenyl-3-methyl-5-hydroxy-6-metoxy-1,4-benzoquinol methylase
MFQKLEAINARPKPFEFYTARDLWTDEHTSQQMLALHLNEQVDAASRNSAFIDRSVAWIAARFGVGPGTRIVDFGCGPGLYATRLAQRGASVTAIDFSDRSIQYGREVARREGLSVCYVQEDYLQFNAEDRFDLALMIMCDFCALSLVQRQAMLTKFRTLLKPDGAVLLDVYSLAAFAERKETALYELNQLSGFWSAEKYYGFLNTFKYEHEKLMLDKYTLVEEKRTRTVYNWLQYFTPDTLGQEFAACGLAVEAVYSDVAGSAYTPESTEFAVVGQRSRSAALATHDSR